MKNTAWLLILIPLFGVLPLNLFAQHSHSLSSKPKMTSLIQFPDRPAMLTTNSYIDPQEYESMDLLNDSLSSGLCHRLNLDYILIIKMKSKYKVFTLDDILNRYNVPVKYRKLTVKVDDDTLSFPETLIISARQIATVKVVNEKFIKIHLTSYEALKHFLKDVPGQKRTG